MLNLVLYSLTIFRFFIRHNAIVDAEKKITKIRFKYPPFIIIQILPGKYLVTISSIRKRINGKKNMIHLGYKVFLFQT